MEQNYQLDLVLELQGAQVVEYVNKQQKLLTQGNLGIYEIKSLQLFVMKVNDWQYTLNKEIPVMKEQQRSFAQFIYVVPQQAGQFGVIVPGNTPQQLLDCFESVLNQHSQFVVPDQHQMALQACDQGIINDPELKKSIVKDKDGKITSSKVGAFIHLGGDVIRQGLISGAKMISKGIKSGGEFIQTKITKPTPVAVDPKTMQKVRTAQTGSAIMLQYTRQQIEALYTALKTAAVAAGKEIETSDTGVKMKNHENYNDVKNVAKGTLHGVAAVYDGLFEALCEIGRGCGQATVGVVDKKYGHEAAEATQQGVKIVGNVGYIVNTGKDVVQKDIVKQTDNQTYDGVKPELK